MSRDVCKCGHAKDTHYKKISTCLGVHCDCFVYRDEDLPDPPKPKLSAHPEIRDTAITPLLPHPSFCDDCSKYDPGDP